MTFKEEIENMTDEEFLEMFLNDEFLIPDIYMPDDFGIRLLADESFTYSYGNQDMITSAESAEQHIREVWESSQVQITALDYIGENDYYYSFHSIMTWDGGYTALHRHLIFKSNAVFSHNSRAVIGMLDKQSFTDVADIMFSAMWFGLPEVNTVIYREVEETEDTYVYTYYLAEKRPDVDFVFLSKRQNTVCRLTGRFIGYEKIEQLKRVQIY
ncbi:MAG: hypothetical protein LBC86_05905 [Oscillospiraceae bacterium]|jgi:hypothetical protein|nr:hypothetical protein [Oscillospiraceae bacterium]